MKRQRQIRFLSKRTIVSLIGIDYQVIRKAGEENLQKFYITGLLVIVILFLSFFSTFYAFELMFHMWYAEVFFSLFIALMFFSIYVLLIQTFSKTALPTKSFPSLFTLPNLSRLGFVLLISFILAQPIKIFILRDSLNRRLAAYKTELYTEYTKRLSQLHAKDRLRLLSERDRIAKYAPKTAAIESINSRIIQIDAMITQDKAVILSKITASDFFIKQILLSNKSFTGWVICILIVGIFVIPVALIYSISSNSQYYQLKKRRDMHIVTEDYARFKKRYSEIFLQKFSIPDILFYETFDDPPFNTRRKEDIKPLTHVDFKNKFLG